MDIVVQIMGIVILLIAILFLIKPDIMKRMVEFLKQGKRIYFIGIIRLAVAIVFLLAARECDITWVILTFGIIFLISGLLIFMLGPRKVKPMLDWFGSKSALFLRIMAVIVLAVGGVIIYSA